jgi:hypothetical protein
MPGGGGEATGGAGSNAQVAAQRQRLLAEIKSNPQLAHDIANMMGHETNNPQGATAVLESLFNRTLRKGSTLARELRSGFYGPINRGEVKLGRQASSWAFGQYSAALSNVASGSNLIGGRDDQGMRREIHGPGAINVGGEWFGYMGASSRDWASRQPSGGGGGGVPTFTTEGIRAALSGGDGGGQGGAVTPKFDTGGKDWRHLNPEFVARLNAAYEAMPESAKKSFRLSSGYRSYAEQAEIYRRSGGGRLFAAAPPGHSRHESGQAVDIPRGEALTWLQTHGEQFGVGGILGGLQGRDPVHIQMRPGGQQFFRGGQDTQFAQNQGSRADVHINVSAPRNSKVTSRASGKGLLANPRVKTSKQGQMDTHSETHESTDDSMKGGPG